MDKVYTPQNIEQKWYQYWEQQHLFQPKTQDQAYCIMLPPPNVTGSLHMGHAFQDTLMDVLIRYHRMLGHETLWQGGTDHAGIATQMLVERKLLAQGISKESLGREAFIEKVWEWKAQSGNTISQQMRRLGTSIDWERERFTLDDGLCNAVQQVFVNLYQQGLIYRDQALVNWDPKLHTAVSDLEVIAHEEPGELWYLRYPLPDQSGYLVVATTRPETLFGDAAVAVHPDDSRYQALIGQQVCLPLCDRSLPIIADPFVDPEFGSGCVKITPAHDFNDYAIGKKHNLAMRNIFTKDAKLNQQVPTAFQGLSREQGRIKVLQALTEHKLIEKTQAHTLKVPRGDRSGEIIEPYLTSQWFVKTKPLAKEAIDVVARGKIKFVPENWSKTYFEWMNNIQDWCISRQLWWGHQIPAWYDSDGNIYVGYNEAQVRQEYQLSDELHLTQDPDVLDTWFSSALWPFSTLGWPEQTPALTTFYPTQVLVTGFDIIFFWVARMIMFGLKFTGNVPFHTVFVHGLIQDADGQKMSKSKGNIIDPLDLIDGITLPKLLEKRLSGLMQPAMAQKIEAMTRKAYPQGLPAFGTDALRFSFCALATMGRYLRFDLSRVATYRNFCNKLWNASRFVMMHQSETKFEQQNMQYGAAEQWIWSQLQQLKQNVAQHFQDYRFDLASHNLYEFVWNTYCDWYIEFAKATLNQSQAEPNLLMGTRYTLMAVLEELLRLLHPIMPFITEELWQRLKPELNLTQPSSIMQQAYPRYDATQVSSTANAAMHWVQSFISAIRTIRSEMNVAPSLQLTVLCRHGTKAQHSYLNQNLTLISYLAKINTLKIIEAQEKVPMCATALAGEMEILLPMSGLIDKAAETQRLTKELGKLNAELAKVQGKLNNAQYLAKAPEAIVSKEQQRLTETKSAIQHLSQQLDKIAAL
jgi:valyl-tRNA synthetase